MRLFLRYYRVAIFVILIVYISSYAMLVSRGLRQSRELNFPTFYYSSYDPERNPRINLESHYFLVVFYRPANYLHRTFFDRSVMPTGRLRGISYGFDNMSDE
jgi:hypothetical protein